MKHWIFLLVPVAVVALWICFSGRWSRPANYVCITPEEAKQIMDNETGYIILDVRTYEEFETGHIPGAVCLPLDEVASKAKDVIPDQDATYLVYCRSGRRSKEAAKILVELGYTGIKEFGGIVDWPYAVEK